MKQIFTLLLLLCHIHLLAADKFFAAPTTAPKDFKVTSPDGDRVSLSWTVGNGTRRLVIARKGAPVTFVPVNGVSYNASATFGSGNEVATGEFVVYNNTSNSTTVSGLQANTHYHFAIFEFNGTGAGIEYNTTITATSGSTLSAPTTQVTNLNVTGILGHSLTLNWTNPPAGSAGSGRMIIGREGAPVNINPVDLTDYTASPAFGNGTEIGSGNFVLGKTNGASLTVTTLKPGTTYYFAVFEYRGSNGLVFNINTPPTASATTAPRPTQNATGAKFENIEGTSMRFYFTKGNGARRLVVAKAGGPVTAQPVDGENYTANTTFGTAGTAIAPGEYVVGNGNIEDVSINGLTKSTTYHFAVFEYDGTGTFTRYLTENELTTSQSTATAPTVPASSPVVSNVLNTSVKIEWTSGNGERRIVVVRKDGPVNVLPVDLIQYSGSPNFGSGSQIGTGNYVVFANTSNNVTIGTLAAGSTYHFAIFEYNGTGKPVYLTSNAPTGQFTTAQSPTAAPTGFKIGSVEGNRLTYEWDNGNGTHRLVVIKAGSAVTAQPTNGVTYNANATFGSGAEIAAGEFVIMSTNSQQITPTNLQPGTTYHIAVFEYNLINGQPYYLTTPGRFSATTASSPTTQSTNLAFSNVIGNGMKLTWVKGDGGKRIVVAKMVAPVDVLPANFTSYNYSSNFGNSTQIGNGNYVVYAGTENHTSISGLLPGVTYHFAVFEYNGSNHPVYLTAGALTGSQKTADRPTVPSKDIYYGTTEGNRLAVLWTIGNGVRRVVIARAGSAVTAMPQDGIDYTANAAFGNGTEILPGQFVVGTGNINDLTVTGLQPATTYHFAVFEYDGTGAGTRYLTSSYASGSKSTAAAPSSGATNILYAAIGTTTASINWTVAAADRHMVVIRKAQPVTAVPEQLKSYNANTAFGNNSSMMSPEHYVIFSSGNANSVNVTSLQPGTTYHIAVYAYNGSSYPVYNLANVATSSFTTLGPPTEAAKDIITGSAGDGTSVTIRWKNGSGQRRLVLMRAGSAVSTLPGENIAYSANSFFGSGHDFGNGNYAVYNGFADHVTVSNLQKNQVYHIAVFEYNQFTTGPVYLTTSFAQGQFSGSILPVKLAQFSGLATATSNQLHWTTSQEINTAAFVIERSLNGTAFEAIGSVAASGNSTTSQSYLFDDRNRAAVSYYRLRIMDANGKQEFSNIIRLQTAKAEGLKLFPTVATSSVQLNLTLTEKATTVLRIVDINGRVQVQQQANLEAGTVSRTMDVSQLIRGTYFMQVQIGERLFTERFIKQ